MRFVLPLIVDSDQFAVEILRQIFEGFGLPEARSVDNVEAARELLPDRKFDLLVCEAMLKDGLGADLVRWVRAQANPRLRYIPIVMLTGQVGELGEAKEPNLSQDEIDGFMKPARMMVFE